MQTRERRFVLTTAVVLLLGSCLLTDVSAADEAEVTQQDTVNIIRELAKLKKEEREAQERQAQKQHAEQELVRRKALSVSTRLQIKQRGTRVCFVDSLACDTLNCTIDDFNPANQKVRVLISGDATWTSMERWFACE